jgi:MFS family permease
LTHAHRTVLTFIDASGPSQDIPLHLSSYLVAIANAGSAIGRLSSGILTDRVGASSPPRGSPSRFISSHRFIPTAPASGPLNVMTPALFFAGVMTFLWPHAHGPGMLIPLALFYGAASGAYVGVFSTPLIALGDSRDVGRRIGMFLTILSLGALAGPPISGAIVSATGGYDAVGNYAGMFPPLPPSFFNLFLCPVRD